MNSSLQLVDLTPRESEIAEVIAWGHSKKEVPDYVSLTRKGKPISVRTVDATVRNIYEKWKIQKATELTVAWFVKNYNIPLSQCPVKKTFITVSFLLIFLPFEIFTHQETLRYGRSLMESRRSEARRSDDLLTIEF